MEQGLLLLLPGTNMEKVVSCYEQFVGQARAQTIPCDASIQQPVESACLSPRDASNYAR